MAVPLNTESQTDRALRALAREQKEEADGRATAWAVVWTLFVFKMATVAIIWYAASGSAEANAYLAATTWYWIFIPGVAFSGVIAYRWRLIRMRRQRQRLQRSEWTESAQAGSTTMTEDDIRVLIQPDPGNQHP